MDAQDREMLIRIHERTECLPDIKEKVDSHAHEIRSLQNDKKWIFGIFSAIGALGLAILAGFWEKLTK